MSSRYTQNYLGVSGPPSNHPSHTGGNNSNGQQKLHQNVVSANAVQQQQMALEQQKSKLVNTEYTIGINHQPASHQPSAVINQNYRLTHPSNSSYHVTPTSSSYSQSGPVPQQQQQQQQQIPTGGPGPLRKTITSTTNSSSQQQDKMQPQQPQPQSQPQIHHPIHMSHPRQPQPPYPRNPTNAPPSRGGISNTGSQQINSRQTTHQHAPTAQPTTQIYMYPVNNYLYPHPRLANFPPNSLPQYYSYPQYVTSPNVIMQPHQQQRPNGSASHLQSTQLSSSVAGSVSGATTTPLPHQQNSHQQQLAGIPQLGAQGSHHQMSTPLYQIPAAMQRSTPDNKKRQRNPIPIIDPNSGEAILVNNKSTTSSHSSSSNTHSAALKIEAPMSPPIAVSPAGNTTAIESDISDIPHVQSDFEPMMNVGDPTYTCETEVANVDEQPHTPIVSANADGPSVDITPKPSKNVKRANKSDGHSSALTIEKPADFTSANQRKGQSSVETRTNAECDKSSKSTPTSSEWVKNVQTNTRSSVEHENPAQPNPYAPAPQHTHNKMKDRATVATAATPLPTAAVPSAAQITQKPTAPSSSAIPIVADTKQTTVQSNKAINDSNGVSTPSQTAKPTSTPVPVSSAFESPETTAKIETSSVETNTKVVPAAPAAAVPAVAAVAAEATTPIAENIKSDSSSSSSTLSNTSTASVDQTDRVAADSSIDSGLDSNCNMETNYNNNSINVSSKVAAPSAAIAVAGAGETSDNKTKETSSNNSAATAAETIEADAETINNIKNNNLSSTTNSTSSVENNNVVIDQDVDNNTLAVSADVEQSPSSASTTESAAAMAATDEAADGAAPVDGDAAAAAGAKAAASVRQMKYEDGQWSPNNVDGKKCYNRDQLITLRNTVASQASPPIQDRFQLIAKKNNFMPNFASGGKNQSSSSSNRNQYPKRPSSQGQQQMQQGGGKGSRSGMIHVSLSLREDVKLNESTNAWKPTFLTSNATVEHTDPNNIEALCKKVRGILNKLTPEKFDPLLEQLQALNINNSEKLSNVISLVFEKAIDEPNFSSAYAALCKKLSAPIQEENERKRREEGSNAGAQKQGGAAQTDFKKELLNKCQKEFDNHVADENSMRQKLTPLETEISETTDPNRKLELRAQLEEEERKLRRRSVGTVRFIGELYQQGMLVTNIMDWCINALLRIRTEEKLECLCKLLTTVGKKMEQKTPDEAWNAKQCRDLTEQFKAMEKIASDKKSPKISSRVRFMLLDVIELRRNKWVPRRNEANPKTMDQIQKDVEAEQHSNKMMMMLSNSSGGGGGMGNNNMRKDNRERNDRGGQSRGSMSGNYNMNNNNNKGSMRGGGGYQENDGWIQQGSNKGRNNNTNPTFDPSKFKGKANIDDQTSLGSSNLFKWSHNKASIAPTPMANSFSVLESDMHKSGGLSGYRSKEPYQSKGSMERERDGHGSRSGSQQGSRDNSAARNSYSSSRSLQQMRPSQMQFNTLPLSSSSMQKGGLRGDNKLNQHISLSSSTTSLSYNMPSMTPTSSDPKLSTDVSVEMLKVIQSQVKTALTSHQNDEFRNYNDLENAPQLEGVPEHNRWAVVRELHNMGVDLKGMNSSNRNFIGVLCLYWIKQGRLTKQDYARGLTGYLDCVEDVAIDVPKVFEYTASMIAPAIKDDVISLSELQNIATGLIKANRGGELIGALLVHLAYEYGPCYARDLWRRSDCRWQQFVQDDVKEFIQQYNLHFIENSKESLPPAETIVSSDKLKTRLRELVRRNNASEEISEYIKVNVPVINKQSIRLLTKTLVEASLENGQVKEELVKKWIGTLKNYIGNEDQIDLQVECLYAVQLLSHELEHPSGLLRITFGAFYDDDFILAAAFKKWEKSTEVPLGKGVAIKNLTSFFQVIDDNERDENDDED